MEQKKDKKVFLHIGIVFGVVLLLLVALIVGAKIMYDGDGKAAPIMLKEQCGYEMYEIRNDTVLLTYRITLQNNSGEDLEKFAMRAVLNADKKSGYLLDSKATVQQWGTHETLFTLRDGETQTWDLVLTAPYYPSDKQASGALPQLYIIYPDGSENPIHAE